MLAGSAPFRAAPAAPQVLFRKRICLALTLLVLGVLADDHDAAFALDDLALLANRFHRGSDFHFYISLNVVEILAEADFLLVLGAPGDAPPGQIVHGQFHGYLVSRQDPDVVHTEFAGNGGQDLMSVLESNLEHRVGVCVGHNAFYFKNILFGQA